MLSGHLIPFFIPFHFHLTELSKEDIHNFDEKKKQHRLETAVDTRDQQDKKRRDETRQDLDGTEHYDPLCAFRLQLAFALVDYYTVEVDQR